MDAQTAVALAKSEVTNIFADEGIVNVGLEELEYVEDDDTWRVTIGFSRPWDANTPTALNSAMNVPPLRRTYKVVTIDDQTRRFLRVANRDVQAA